MGIRLFIKFINLSEKKGDYYAMRTTKNLFPIYKKAFFNATREAIANEENKSLFHKTLFNGVKMFCHAPKSTSYQGDLDLFHIAEAVKHTVGYLTPIEFMNIFPPEKVYDGHKYEVKDYFSTMEEVKKLDLYEPLANQINPLSFMFEYHNWDVHRFNIKLLKIISNLKQAQGQLGLSEEFMAAHGIETPNTFKNSQGQTMYVCHGKPVAIGEQKKTGHLQVVK